MRAIAVSSLGLLLTSTLELTVVVFSGSVALLADGLHNLGDVFTTVWVYFGFRTSRRVAGIQSCESLPSGRGTNHLTLGTAAAVIGIVPRAR
jgi:hypothetical protein